MCVGLPSLPCLEAPDMAPWTDSEAWLTVFLGANWVSKQSRHYPSREQGWMRGMWGRASLDCVHYVCLVVKGNRVCCVKL